MKKKPKWTKFAVIIIIVGLIGGALWYSQNRKQDAPVITVLSEIEGYAYQLESNEGKTYEKYFKELEEILKKNPVDEEDYVRHISQLFLLDFYTLKNKTTNKDIGGVQFVYESARENFQLKAADTVYKYIKSNLYGNRKQTLPEVEDVEIESVEESKVTYKNTSDDHGYRVKAKVKYKKDLGYPTEINLTFLHESSKISLTEME